MKRSTIRYNEAQEAFAMSIMRAGKHVLDWSDEPVDELHSEALVQAKYHLKQALKAIELLERHGHA